MPTLTDQSIWAYRMARKVVITLGGLSIVVVGIVMLVLPGPAIIVIPAGLAILGLEYRWARRWLARVKQGGSDFAQWLRSRKDQT